MPKYEVHRSIVIAADPQTVFDRVVDYGTWTQWSPWLIAEPEAKVTVSDDPRSVGSTYAWSGEVVGAGELEHESLKDGEQIRDEIRFLRPMKSVSKVGFDFKPVDGGTEVTWSMGGSLPFFLFFLKGQIESFVGMDYDRGLRMLKEWIESGHIESKTTVVGTQSMGPFQVVGVSGQSSLKSIGPAMDEAFSKAQQELDNAGLPTDGEKVSIYHKFTPKTEHFEFTCGFLFGEPRDSVPSHLSVWHLPQTQAFRVDHLGSYANLGNAWSAANQHVRYKKLKQSTVGTFELYKNSPENAQPSDLLTEIYLPLK